MSDRHLLNAILNKYEAMSPSVRKAKIRKLSTSAQNRKFIQKYFSALFYEAFPDSSVGGCSKSNQPCELAAKHR